MRVLGIDPGTATVGYGVVERSASLGSAARLVECGVLRTPSRELLQNRLAVIHAGLCELIERHRPDVLAVEDIFYATNVRTTVVLGHARGVILLAGAQAGILVAEYSPALVKKTVVGRGAALKPQVGFMVAKLLKLSAAPKPADAADAVAVALTHLLTGFRRNGR
ncbi:MAG TPA: crossover junction endodeoxyribonuclease RuvC [Gemmatimonadales bacterium]|jgi:crossover junction endodeoxyribonuclease RuvC|nr:crossover junction endodeoxyribonuclease RuvC [Gemmatimonadales bacterium]